MWRDPYAPWNGDRRGGGAKRTSYPLRDLRVGKRMESKGNRSTVHLNGTHALEQSAGQKLHIVSRALKTSKNVPPTRTIRISLLLKNWAAVVFMSKYKFWASAVQTKGEQILFLPFIIKAAWTQIHSAHSSKSKLNKMSYWLYSVAQIQWGPGTPSSSCRYLLKPFIEIVLGIFKCEMKYLRLSIPHLGVIYKSRPQCVKAVSQMVIRFRQQGVPHMNACVFRHVRLLQTRRSHAGSQAWMMDGRLRRRRRRFDESRRTNPRCT